MAHFEREAQQLVALADVLLSDVKAGRLDQANETARKMMSVLGGLGQRLSVVSEMFADGYFAAEVDRALKPKP